MTIPLTARELRIVSDYVERYSKARVMNTKIGMETTPDLLAVDFPNGFSGTLIWTPGRRGNTSTEHRALERHARHRDSYQLDLATLKAAGRPKGDDHADMHQRNLAATAKENRRVQALREHAAHANAQGDVNPAVVAHMTHAVQAGRNQQNTA